MKGQKASWSVGVGRGFRNFAPNSILNLHKKMLHAFVLGSNQRIHYGLPHLGFLPFFLD